MTTPNRPRLVEGKLQLEDGGDPTEYLKDFAQKCGITPETPMTLTRRDCYLDLRYQAALCAIG